MQGTPEEIVGEDGLLVSPWAVYNIEEGTLENLLEYISTLQQELVSVDILPEDYADSKAFEEYFGFRTSIDIHEWLGKYAQWYRNIT